MATSMQLESYADHLHAYADGSAVPNTGSSACVADEQGLPVHASSTAAEAEGLHLAVDLLTKELPRTPVVIYHDSKAALLSLQRAERASMGVALLSTRLAAIQDTGCLVSLQWLPAHVGIPGKEEADRLAESAHDNRAALSTAVTAGHHKASLAAPPTGMPRRSSDASPEGNPPALTRIGCIWTGYRRYRMGLVPSPACTSCGEPESLANLLLTCPAHIEQRRHLQLAYRTLGLPSGSQEGLLLPGRHRGHFLQSLVKFQDFTGLSFRL
ncbi:hypothetical protein HPB52_025018 [Rhipicephalus sanguineus]|uniref:RNase H type-1 domain-containing protein n=1 Tax=Rhipicephalus sanguineus TaxID=34632 RepID=A0A9D4PAB4_RHISA|nr:hypothetical protein HPB52_025018 [Rhipicephalus sanguineus]